MQVTKFNLVTDLQIMLSNVPEWDFEIWMYYIRVTYCRTGYLDWGCYIGNKIDICSQTRDLLREFFLLFWMSPFPVRRLALRSPLPKIALFLKLIYSFLRSNSQNSDLEDACTRAERTKHMEPILRGKVKMFFKSENLKK